MPKKELIAEIISALPKATLLLVGAWAYIWAVGTIGAAFGVQ